MIRHIRHKIIGLLVLWIKIGFMAYNVKVRPEKIKKVTYRDLLKIREAISVDAFTKLLSAIFEEDVKRIKNKEKVKISFLMYDTSLWCGNKLYELFKRDKRYDVDVIVCRRHDNRNANEDKNFQCGVERLKKTGVDVIPVYEDDDYNDVVADVLFFLTPYDGTLADQFKFKKLTVDRLICYIHYGFSTNDMDVELPIRHILWKEFVGDKEFGEKLKKQIARNDEFIKYTGYPKLDYFYENNIGEEKENKENKTIIWAPHWSIDDGLLYATFQDNYEFFLEYAKKNPEIKWIVKPHPNLFFSAVKSGLFSSEAEFARYMDEWSSLPNAEVVVGGNYQNQFCKADAMILDSASFIAEYQYVDKPMLFLRRDTQTFNHFAKKIVEASYTVDGNDLSGIEMFIHNVVVNGDDYKKDIREKTFKTSLDYYSDNGMLASDNIVGVIKKYF